MKTSRREFIRYCGASAAALGLTATDLLMLEEALANPAAPSVLWLQGASCTGCSVSLLNLVSTAQPYNVADLLINSINLAYHPQLSAASGALAIDTINKTYQAGGYVLAVEGGVPTAFGGAACWAWGDTTGEVTFANAVRALGSRAAAILAVGTCAAWGGIPAAGPNPTGVRGLGAFLGRPTINVAGCPPHPDWIVWPIVQLLLNRPIELDGDGRPRSLYARSVHDVCPLKGTSPARSLAVPNRCLKELGCRGPQTKAPCPIVKWNGGVNWCVGAGAPCLGCTSRNFPGTEAFYKDDR